MNVAVFASGSQGDVQPYLALASGLKRAGHNVHLLTHSHYKDAAETLGLTFHELQGNPQALMDSPRMRELLARGNILAINAFTSKELQRVALLWAQAGLDACRDAHVILAGVGGMFTGLSVAERLNVPFVLAPVFPFTPTTEFAGPLFPQHLSSFGGAINRFSHHAVRQVMWQSVRSATQRARREVLELPDAPLLGPYNDERLNRYPTLYGISPAVIPQPKDWRNALMCGYWFLDAASDWSPPPALQAFLDAGEPPVYIGFGSMGSRDPEQTAALVLEAVRASGQRAILQSGWGGLHSDELPVNVQMIASAPHAWLFSKVSAVVHHGGAGTTAAGLRAGAPTLVTPFFGDQGFWGERVAALGVGPAPIPRKTLTAERLTRALETLASDTAMRARAATLGERIRAEDGIAAAVAEVERIG